MPNERLRAAIVAARHTPTSVSDAIRVDRKTVDRWIAGRLPHYTHRVAVAGLLEKDDVYLFPQTATSARTQAASAAEVIAIHPSRGAVPATTWASMLDNAVESVDVLAYAATFLSDSIDDLVGRLRKRARSGVRIRLLLGDPASAAVARRGQEEGIGSLVTSRCELSWNYLSAACAEPGVEARKHATTLYTSIFQFDEHAFVNVHAYAAPASHSPVIHLQRIPGGRMFDHYMRSFDKTWQDAITVRA